MSKTFGSTRTRTDAYWKLSKGQPQGSITKAGNSGVRQVLVQAAWSCCFPPRRGEVMKRRQQGQPPDAMARTWKAQHRLHKVFKRLVFRKNSQMNGASRT